MIALMVIVSLLACPSAQHARSNLQFKISKGCRVPVAGARIYTADGHVKISVRLAAVEAVANEREKIILDLRTGRDAEFERLFDKVAAAADKVGGIRVDLSKTKDDLKAARKRVKDQTHPLLWVGTGVLSTLAVGAGSIYLWKAAQDE